MVCFVESAVNKSIDINNDFEWITYEKAKTDEYLKKYKCLYNNRDWLLKDPCLSTGKGIKGILAIDKKDAIAGYGFVTGKRMIFSVYVFPEYRKLGLATKVISIAVNDLNGNWLEVEKTNSKAIRLYKKLGFEITGEGKCYGENSGDKKVPCYIMKISTKIK